MQLKVLRAVVLRAVAPLLFLLPAALLAQDAEWTEPDGITNVAYLSDRAVVTEVTAFPDLLDMTVELVEARVLGQDQGFASLRFSRKQSPTLATNGYAAPSASIPRNHLAAAASQLQLVSDELLGTTPDRPTAFAYRSQEGVNVLGEWRDGAWHLRMELSNYGQDGGGTALTPADLEQLIQLLQSAAEGA